MEEIKNINIPSRHILFDYYTTECVNLNKII